MWGKSLYYCVLHTHMRSHILLFFPHWQTASSLFIITTILFYNKLPYGWWMVLINVHFNLWWWLNYKHNFMLAHIYDINGLGLPRGINCFWRLPHSLTHICHFPVCMLLMLAYNFWHCTFEHQASRLSGNLSV